MDPFHRKALAALLLAAIVVIGFPSAGIAGGCDEPGYTGGSCGRSENQGSGGGGDDAGTPPPPPEPTTQDDGGSGDPTRMLTLPNAMSEGASTLVMGVAQTWLTLFVVFPSR